MVNLYVEFLSMTDGKLGAPLGDPILTDESGLAVFPVMMPIGNYVARVEYQKPKVVCTVFEPNEPEILVLPIGRPYWCVDGDIEFEPGEEK
jgi:hypothetical protein